jgi:hypothetical protein
MKAKKEKEETTERRAMAISAAMEAEALMRELHKKNKKASTAPYVGATSQVSGVQYHNPYPVRKVTTQSIHIDDNDINSNSNIKSVTPIHDFSLINKEAKKSVLASTIASVGASASSNDNDNEGTLSYPFSYTLKTGSVLKAKTLEELQAKIIQATRTINSGTNVSVSPIKGSSNSNSKVSKGTKSSNNSSSKNTLKNISKFEDAVKGLFATGSGTNKNIDNDNDNDWVKSTENILGTLTSRSDSAVAVNREIVKMTSTIEKTDFLHSQDDALLQGNSNNNNNNNEEPGFLNAYKADISASTTSNISATTATATATTTGKKTKKHKKNLATAAVVASGNTKQKDALAVTVNTTLKNVNATEAAAAAAASSNDDAADMELLKRQLESQGVTVDDKMESILRSLREESD